MYPPARISHCLLLNPCKLAGCSSPALGPRPCRRQRGGPGRVTLSASWRAVLCSLTLAAFPTHAADGLEVEDFFERRIRPVLVEHCYACHSIGPQARAKPVKGGLRLDTPLGLRRGGGSGAVVVPGDAGASLLIRALHHRDDSLRMPPAGRLPDSVIRDFESWVEAGALDPRQDREQEESGSAGRHWAFRPVRRPPPPLNASESAVDAFVSARLAEAGLTFSAEANRRTLIRRLHFDLIGLPPTFEDVERFERDRSPDAYARLVERLLATPQYGERWGRHWLDVARYSDTKDIVLVRGKDAIRPYAYTYRDYVIRAFNEDTSYDRFVAEQLAASELLGEDAQERERWRLAGMGFLTVGRVFNNINPHDIYDDQIDVVSRGLLGLTVSCARCHDHKYDPIPTADYYSLHGVFANSVLPERFPLIARPDPSPGYDDFAKQEAEILERQRTLVDKHYQEIRDQAARSVADYLEEIVTEEPDPLATAIFYVSLSPDDLRPRMLHRWRQLLEQRSRADDPVFGPWHDLLAVPEDELPLEAETIVERWRSKSPGTAPGELNPRVAARLDPSTLSTRRGLAQTYGGLLVDLFREFYPGGVASASLPAGDVERQLLDLVVGEKSPFHFLRRDTWQYLSRVPLGEYRGTQNQLDSLAVKSESAPPRAMTLIDARELYEPRVFVRGDPTRPGRSVPRRFLSVLDGEAFSRGAGRLELARSITAADNPLTARVIVNRVWMHHFGEPLVATPSDFGVRSDPPSHPDLLDYLATTLIDDGWSLKSLHRRLVLSRAYRQSSEDRPSCRDVDPDNRLLWRAHRRRLDLEAMRDGLLVVSGRLDRRMAGRPVEIAQDARNRRRTVYGVVDRQDLPSLFRSFDFASPDQTAARRPQTTVPQQALFALNSPFILEQVRALVARREVVQATEGPGRVQALYRLVLARAAGDDEATAALELVREAEREAANVPLAASLGASETAADASPPLRPWEQLAHVLLLTNEFAFVD